MSEEINEQVISARNVKSVAEVNLAEDYIKWLTPQMRRREVVVDDCYGRPWATEGFTKDVINFEAEEEVQDNFLVEEQIRADKLEKVKRQTFKKLRSNLKQQPFTQIIFLGQSEAVCK